MLSFGLEPDLLLILLSRFCRLIPTLCRWVFYFLKLLIATPERHMTDTLTPQ